MRLVLYGRKKKSHFAGKMDFLAKGKKSYYTEKSHLKKVILSKEWFSPQKVTFFRIIWKKKPFFMPNGPKWLFKNDFFWVHLTLKMVLMQNAKIRKNHFMTKMVFFFILYGKNMTFWEKNHFAPQNHYTPLMQINKWQVWLILVTVRERSDQGAKNDPRHCRIRIGYRKPSWGGLKSMMLGLKIQNAANFFL